MSLHTKIWKRQRAIEEGTAEEPVLKIPRRLPARVARVDSKRPSTALRVRESALFRPIRAIGAVTDGVPLSHVLLGTADFVTASIGRGFQVFNCEHLRPAYIGPRLNEKIRALHSVGEVVLTSMKKDIIAWYKLTELGRFRGHTSTATVLCNVGTGFLLSGSETEVLVWQLSDVGAATSEASGRKSCILAPLSKLAVAGNFGACTAACHPPTYLHKILIASSSGCLDLWNVRSCQLVHSFKSHKARGKPDTPITCICEAPNALDMVAVGFANGRICILNAREDSVQVEFEQVQGRITALAFRTGAGAPAHLVSGAPDGAFVVWDLNKRRAHHVHEGVHHGPITSATFLFDQPVLITGGRDNAIRMWIFDTPDGLPRLLRQRRGCPGPIRRMSFYGNQRDQELLVGGSVGSTGYLSKISFGHLTQNAEYSQAALKKAHLRRVPPVVDVAFCYARHWDWPAVITVHEDCDAALVWSAQHHALNPGCLRLPPEADCTGVAVTAVAASHCGNYCVLGLENGTLHHFNLQSQLHRGPFPKPPEMPEEAGKKARAKAAVAKTPQRAHTGRVSGIAITVDGKVVSVASHPSDCKVKLWKLLTHQALAEVPLGSGKPGTPSCLLLRIHGALIATSLDDGTLEVADLQGLNVVRSFDCGQPATDAAFSSDGRWLAAALRDGGLRIFDLPAARCVDSFAFAQPAISVCFSPSNAFLLTSHAKGFVIQVWANKFLFDTSVTAPLLQTECLAPISVDEPGDDAEEEEEGGRAHEGGERGAEATGGSRTQEAAAAAEAANPLAPELLTLSDVPPQKWLATLHLDLVKERNKAAEPPKPLPNAPFFLPTVHEGVRPRFAAPLGEDGEGQDPTEAANLSRILRGERRPLEGTEFQVKLRKRDYDGALAFLKQQTPSGVHLAIEELGDLAGGDKAELKSALEFFLFHTAKAHYADEVQAFLSLFLQAHSEELAEEPELRALCARLSAAQDSLWTTLSTQCQKARCFLGILTQTQTQW